MICENCKNEHDGSYATGRFCSEKCARGFSSKEKRLEINKKVSLTLGGDGKSGYGSCLACGATIRMKEKFCNNKCQTNYFYNTIKVQVENNNLTDVKNPIRIKRYLINKLGHRCIICNLTEWQGQPIPLTLDHIDGNSDNWDVNNLRLICANCDRLQPTYGSKNIGKGRSILRNQKRMNRYYRGVALNGRAAASKAEGR